MPEKWFRFALEAELLSDTHVGSGSGGGGIDALLARDRDDRPVIWASHVEGVLRDAARRCRGDAEAAKFFGSAGGQRQRALFTSLYANERGASHIWRSAARHAFDNRAPKDDTLRVVEYIPRGTKFFGEVELPEEQVGTLKRLVLEVDTLGSGRANGAGRVKLSLSNKAVDERQLYIENPPQQHQAKCRLVLLLQSRDPLCITATATPDNLIPSQSFVPGRALLGAFAAWLIAEDQQQTASLLTSGNVSVSDALPLPYMPASLEHVAVFPAPLALQSKKPKGLAGDVPWWAQTAEPIERLNAWDSGEKLKRPEDDLFVFRETENGDWTTFRPLRRVRLRNGRPYAKDAEPSLFAIEQIAEKTYFFAELEGSMQDMKTMAENLASILTGKRWLCVGRSGAPMEVVKLTWQRIPVTTGPSERAFLTLTSDLLIRDEFLRWRTELDENSLCQVLDVPDIQIVKTGQYGLREFQDSAMVHGFNGTSRLWRMPAAAIRRGSIFEISGNGIAMLAERVRDRRWLGERTHEGFGRFRIDTTLPGVSANTFDRGEWRPTDHSQELISRETQKWFEQHKSLAETRRGNERKPSLAQWRKLVSDLDRNSANALTSRLNPTTAGGKSWLHSDAKAMLAKLGSVREADRNLYARFFVRWLQVRLRSNLK
jgi:hypothetical protein